jgi:branched-subunit amino acid aminotransferase/4-amino-4-deoxychorismate lyase
MSNKPVAVLDTLKFKDGKIFLKKFHIQRTYEALAFKKINVSLDNVTLFYNLIEEETAIRIKPDQILRISIPIISETGQAFEYSFDPVRDLARGSQVEILDAPYFSQAPKLAIHLKDQRPSGIGEQNFKWIDRDFWQKLLAQKNTNVDDIIAINDKDQMTETSRCNILFFDSSKDLVLTPSLDSGCLNGVYRRFIMSQGTVQLPDLGHKKVIEENLSFCELNKKEYSVYVMNSIREVIPASILKNEKY